MGNQTILKEFRDGFCIVIPSLQNYVYLKYCVESIRKYSKYNHQIVVHLNAEKEGSETCQMLEEYNIEYTISDTNLGVCEAVNKASTLCKKELIMYFNDDLVALPEWDTEIVNFAEKHNFGENVWLSSTMIEPHGQEKNGLHGGHFYGKSPQTFDLDRLLGNLDTYRESFKSFKGCTWPPNIMYKSVFDKIGGFSEEYYPGWGSDPDLAKKMWDIGIREFIGIGTSLVYHFQCVTTNRVKNPHNSHTLFEKNHNMSIDHFVYNIMKRGNVWTHKGC